MDLLDGDYEPIVRSKKEGSIVYPPNPFVQDGLWGREDELRQIFERLGKGGSQALIGPVGCGKSEILKAIVNQGPQQLKRPVFRLDMHLVRDERSFFDRLCRAFGLEIGRAHV